MSYDYFLWRTNRPVAPHEIDDTTVEGWSDRDALRKVLSELFPTLVWSADNQVVVRVGCDRS